MPRGKKVQVGGESGQHESDRAIEKVFKMNALTLEQELQMPGKPATPKDLLKFLKENPIRYYSKFDSPFFVVTYWWGGMRGNNNLVRPCPYEWPAEEGVGRRMIYDELAESKHMGISYITEERQSYYRMMLEWRKCCVEAQCNFLDIYVNEFEQPGGYQKAINAKPFFIKRCIDYLSTTVMRGKDFTGVLYIDGDMKVLKTPDIFRLKNVDFMARGWNIDPRSNRKFMFQHPHAEDQETQYKDACFDPYVFETSGGTMYFGNTKTARKMLDLWGESNKKKLNDGKADDRILSWLVTMYDWMASCNIIQLPVEYLWLNDIYEGAVPKSLTQNRNTNSEREVFRDDKVYKFLGKEAAIISHPACLTSEEMAADQGAASDRETKFYEVITDEVKCETYGGFFHEKLFFGNNVKAMSSFKEYHAYLNQLLLLWQDPKLGGGEKPYVFLNADNDDLLEKMGRFIDYRRRYANITHIAVGKDEPDAQIKVAAGVSLGKRVFVLPTTPVANGSKNAANANAAMIQDPRLAKLVEIIDGTEIEAQKQITGKFLFPKEEVEFMFYSYLGILDETRDVTIDMDSPMMFYSEHILKNTGNIATELTDHFLVYSLLLTKSIEDFARFYQTSYMMKSRIRAFWLAKSVENLKPLERLIIKLVKKKKEQSRDQELQDKREKAEALFNGANTNTNAREPNVRPSMLRRTQSNAGRNATFKG